MIRRMIFPLVLGIGGAAVLIALGTWQIQRLDWKEAILADIDARLTAAPVAVPTAPEFEDDNYLRVAASGKVQGPELHVLTSLKPQGPGFRVIRAFALEDGRDVLIDLGYVPEAAKSAERSDQILRVEGNLIWPRETDSFTPEPNFEKNIWFAREVTAMAEALGTEPLMIALSASEPALDPVPMPVSVNIPNDHLQYAITWFSLAIVWIGMTLFLLWRIKRADL